MKVASLLPFWVPRALVLLALPLRPPFFLGPAFSLFASTLPLLQPLLLLLLLFLMPRFLRARTASLENLSVAAVYIVSGVNSQISKVNGY